jgi:hypothetical protein
VKDFGVSPYDIRKALLEHRPLRADGLNARRPTPHSGYASFCAVFDLFGSGDTLGVALFQPNQIRIKTDIILFNLFKDQGT